MSRILDLTGERFGRLVVLQRAADYVLPSGLHKVMWLCRCDCGRTKEVQRASLRSGRTNSCGCLHNEQLRERSTKHGHNIRDKISPIYRVWASMLGRCRNPNDKRWAHYGGRGINVCPQWHNFSVFLADMGRPPDGLSIDRIDVNGDYCPENCRWATNAEQSRNRTTNHWVTYNGKAMILADAAKAAGLTPLTLLKRIQRGWPEEDLFKPVRPRNHQR
jgi:hypothetical protein